jgi:hypothetical protein
MKKVKLIEQGWLMYSASYWVEYELTDEEYTKLVWGLYNIKLVSNNLVFEENIELKETMKENRLYEIGNEMKLINSEIVQLWWANQFIIDPILESVATTKITDLIAQYNILKEERDSNYTTSMVEDVFNSIF